MRRPYLPRRRRRRRRRNPDGWGRFFRLLGMILLLSGLLLPFLPRENPPIDQVSPAPSLALPEDLSPLRRSMVENAAALTGKVGYFWGGKSVCLGWDDRWGVPAVVTADGSDTTGTLVPFGLDCSGLVTWAAVNAAGDADALSAIGNGARDQYSRCTPVAWEEAQPGDLAFFPDLSHVGIVVGATEAGTLEVVHCSKTLGGVVRSPDGAAIGFTLIGRPAFYQIYGET